VKSEFHGCPKTERASGLIMNVLHSSQGGVTFPKIKIVGQMRGDWARYLSVHTEPHGATTYEVPSIYIPAFSSSAFSAACGFDCLMLLHSTPSAPIIMHALSAAPRMNTLVHA
jgi:hypothetical protein